MVQVLAEYSSYRAPQLPIIRAVVWRVELIRARSTRDYYLLYSPRRSEDYQLPESVIVNGSVNPTSQIIVEMENMT